jgi:hypothetical protein
LCEPTRRRSFEISVGRKRRSDLLSIPSAYIGTYNASIRADPIRTKRPNIAYAENAS